MNISLDWLQDFIAINEPAQQLADRLTMGGLEVEHVVPFEKLPGGLQGVVIGKVVSAEQHPNADRLRVTKVDIGEAEPLDIVCGAPNVREGLTVAVGLVGTTLYPIKGEPFKLKKSKIRGEVSMGMICAEDELGLGHEHDGIMELPDELAAGTPAAEYFKPFADTIIEIGLTPNRVDAASHWGVARDIHALTGEKLKPVNTEAFAEGTEKGISVEVEDTTACPRYTSLTLKNVTVKDSPEWLQDRLRAIGQEPINNVVDVTNYVLHALGQPLHAFDAAKIAGGKVKVGFLPEGTPFKTLDDVERKLAATDLMICDGNKQPLCIAGVFGGAESGVTAATTEVFLESAYFSPNVVRRTSTHHTLKTEAAFRFERGADPEMTVTAIKYAALLLKEVAGAEIATALDDVYPQPPEQPLVKLRYNRVNTLIGKEIAPERVKEILASLDIKIEKESEEELLVRVPLYRVDVLREADLIEEVLRIYGFDSIEVNRELSSSFMASAAEGDTDPLRNKLSRTLNGTGLHRDYDALAYQFGHGSKSRCCYRNRSAGAQLPQHRFRHAAPKPAAHNIACSGPQPEPPANVTALFRVWPHLPQNRKWLH